MAPFVSCTADGRGPRGGEADAIKGWEGPTPGMLLLLSLPVSLFLFIIKYSYFFRSTGNAGRAESLSFRGK